MAKTTYIGELTNIDENGNEQVCHPVTEAEAVLFNDGETFQKKLDDGELTGPSGKSAYQSAKSGGYTGTETQFNSDLSQVSSKAAASHKHGAGDITSGTLAVARGGTGVTANPSMLTNLGSTSAASVFAASPRPGVTGTLPVANGGTGATTAAAARTALGITPANIGAAASSHGNHVPTTQTANNATFLRNDNTWQKVTPANIGAATTAAVQTAQSTADTAKTNAATALSTANSAASAASAAQTTANSKAPMYTYGTDDLTAGTSALTTGTLHFVYE